MFRDFLETFGVPGAGGPGRHFRDSFGISGPEGPRDLCKGRAGSQTKNDNMIDLLLSTSFSSTLKNQFGERKNDSKGREAMCAMSEIWMATLQTLNERQVTHLIGAQPILESCDAF